MPLVWMNRVAEHVSSPDGRKWIQKKGKVMVKSKRQREALPEEFRDIEAAAALLWLGCDFAKITRDKSS